MSPYACVWLALGAAGAFSWAAPATIKPAAAKHKNAKTKTKVKPQAALAAHSSFATTPASATSVQNALAATNLAGAAKLVGHDVFVKGLVAKVFAPASNSVTILDLAPDYHKAIAVVVKAPAYTKFPALSSLKGRQVLVHGTLILFRKHPEIDITASSQLQIVR